MSGPKICSNHILRVCYADYPTLIVNLLHVQVVVYSIRVLWIIFNRVQSFVVEILMKIFFAENNNRLTLNPLLYKYKTLVRSSWTIILVHKELWLSVVFFKIARRYLQSQRFNYLIFHCKQLSSSRCCREADHIFLVNERVELSWVIKIETVSFVYYDQVIL